MAVGFEGPAPEGSQAAGLDLDPGALPRGYFHLPPPRPVTTPTVGPSTPTKASTTSKRKRAK